MTDDPSAYDLTPVSYDPFPLYPKAQQPQQQDGIQTASIDPMQAMQLLARRQMALPQAQAPASNFPQAGGGLLGQFQKMGYSPAAAAGIVGNFRQESNLNAANDTGDGGTSIGMGQWHNERAANLKQFAASHGADWRDPAVQVAFTDYEVRQNPRLFAALQGARTPQEAADIFSAGFERPNPSAARNDLREAYAAKAIADNGNPNR